MRATPSWYCTWQFQFTHPGRGATRSTRRRLPYQIVSIHAPREGCDYISLADHQRALRFQFTHPGRGATVRLASLNRRLVFQFTHPGRGATGQWRRACTPLSSFNSRTPGGVRQSSSVGKPESKRFQFTHPGRGATHIKYLVLVSHRVSIHAPREGCDGQVMVEILAFLV